MDLETFTVTNVMIHDVPKQDTGEEIVLTDAVVPLDAQLRVYFRRKICESLGNKGLEVLADPEESATVRVAVRDVLADSEQLVEASKRVANHLNESQNKRNTAGLLIVMTGTVDASPAVAVLKLEREQGIRLEIREARVMLQFLRDLTLTDKTKIFKTSLFQLGRPGEPESLFGLASDDQRGRDDGTGVATFFLSTFLGCRLKVNPARATAEFVAAAEAFVNEDVPSDEKKGRYLVSLQATLQDQQLDIAPRGFAETQLDPEDRPAFLNRVREKGIDPHLAFAKDVSLVKMKGFKMTFRHGMVLLGTQQDLSDRVDLPPDGNAGPVIVRDGVSALQLKGR